MNMILRSAGCEQREALSPRNAAQVSVELGGAGSGNERTPIFRAEDAMNEICGKGMRHPAPSLRDFHFITALPHPTLKRGANEPCAFGADLSRKQDAIKDPIASQVGSRVGDPPRWPGSVSKLALAAGYSPVLWTPGAKASIWESGEIWVGSYCFAEPASFVYVVTNRLVQASPFFISRWKFNLSGDGFS